MVNETDDVTTGLDIVKTTLPTATEKAFAMPFNCNSTNVTDVLDAYNCTSGEAASGGDGLLEILMVIGTLVFVVFSALGIGLFCASHKTTRTPKQKKADSNFNTEFDNHHEQSTILHAHANPSFTMIDESNHKHSPFHSGSGNQGSKAQQKQKTSANQSNKNSTRNVSYAEDVRTKYYADSDSSSDSGPKSTQNEHRQDRVFSSAFVSSDNESERNGLEKGTSNLGYQASDESGH